MMVKVRVISFRSFEFGNSRLLHAGSGSRIMGLVPFFIFLLLRKCKRVKGIPTPVAGCLWRLMQLHFDRSPANRNHPIGANEPEHFTSASSIDKVHSHLQVEGRVLVGSGIVIKAGHDVWHIAPILIVAQAPSSIDPVWSF